MSVLPGVVQIIQASKEGRGRVVGVPYLLPEIEFKSIGF